MKSLEIHYGTEKSTGYTNTRQDENIDGTCDLTLFDSIKVLQYNQLMEGQTNE